MKSGDAAKSGYTYPSPGPCKSNLTRPTASQSGGLGRFVSEDPAQCFPQVWVLIAQDSECALPVAAVHNLELVNAIQDLFFGELLISLHDVHTSTLLLELCSPFTCRSAAPIE